MNDLLYNPLNDCEKKEKDKLKSVGNAMGEFVYFVEPGETIVDIAAKFSVSLETIISDNLLSDNPPGGFALVIRTVEKAKPLLPEEIDEKRSIDPYSGVYPFIITKN